MSTRNDAGTQSQEREFVMERVFDAPRDLVWKACTEAERLMQWWGPKGVTMRVATMDLRPGGRFHYCYVMPNGSEMWGIFVYREILPRSGLSSPIPSRMQRVPSCAPHLAPTGLLSS